MAKMKLPTSHQFFARAFTNFLATQAITLPESKPNGKKQKDLNNETQNNP